MKHFIKGLVALYEYLIWWVWVHTSRRVKHLTRNLTSGVHMELNTSTVKELSMFYRVDILKNLQRCPICGGAVHNEHILTNIWECDRCKTTCLMYVTKMDVLSIDVSCIVHKPVKNLDIRLSVNSEGTEFK